MSKILIINSSVSQKESSDSLAMSNLFIEEYKKINTNDEFIHLDLNEIIMASKSLTRNNISEYYNQEESFDYIKQLENVDKIVLNFPMVNLGIPSILKNYIDHIMVPNMTFTYKGSTDGNPIGLLTNVKNVQLLATKGGTGTSNAPFTEYVKNSLVFLGMNVSEPIINEMMDIPPHNEQSPIMNIDKVSEQIIKAAKTF